MIYLARSYLCSYCPQKIDNESDGIVVFGSICVLNDNGRGLKAKINSVPDDFNLQSLASQVTPICWTCFTKKIGPPLSTIKKQESK